MTRWMEMWSAASACLVPLTRDSSTVSVMAFGFEHVRTKGSHRQYVHPNVPRPLPVQPEAKDAKPYQVREFLELVEEYSLYMGGD